MDLLAVSDREVKKHVGAVHVAGRLSLMQRKVSNVLLMNAYEDLRAKDVHRIAVKDLAQLVGFDSHNRDVLKAAVKSLMSLVLEWNILDADGKETDWEAMPMLQYARIQGGSCAYAYPDRLKEKFYNPEIYARISLSLQRRFSSGYALTLHENLVRFRKVGSSGWLPVATLKALLGVEDAAYYDDFRRFNAKILKPAVAEVNATADIAVEPHYRRERRRVVAVKFAVTANPQRALASADPQRARLVACGLTETQAQAALRQHDADYVRHNLDIVEGMLEAGRIKTTLAATTVDALKTDYRPKRAPREAACEAAAAQRKREKAEAHQRQLAEERRQSLEAAFAAHELDQALAALGDDGRQVLERDFTTAIEDRTLPGAAVIRTHFASKGFASKAIQAHFRAFARERLLPGHEPDPVAFERFVQARAGLATGRENGRVERSKRA
jgi:hypothetical protein